MLEVSFLSLLTEKEEETITSSVLLTEGQSGLPGFARNDGCEVTGLPGFARNDGCEVGGLPRFARNDGCEVTGLPRFPLVARSDERRGKARLRVGTSMRFLSEGRQEVGTSVRFLSEGRKGVGTSMRFLSEGRQGGRMEKKDQDFIFFLRYPMTTTTGLRPMGLHKLSNGLYAAFLNVFVAFVKEGTVAKLGIKAEDLTAFEGLMGKLDVALQQARKEAINQELDQLDLERDALLRYLLGTINLGSLAPEVNVQNAAKALADRREKYTGTAKKANLVETTEIKALVADAEKAELAPHFAALGLTGTIAKLKTVNESYTEKWKARIEKQTESPRIVIKKLRPELDFLYVKMTAKINALNIVSPVAETERFVSKMNKLISDTNLAYKQHKAQVGLWTEDGGREDEEEGTNGAEHSSEASS